LAIWPGLLEFCSPFWRFWVCGNFGRHHWG
jgi:hypothetical protein